MIEAKVKFKIKAFDVPTCVYEQGEAPAPAVTSAPAPFPPSYRQEVFSEPCLAPRVLKLSEIDSLDLLSMCAEFTAEVFRRAGKLEDLVISDDGQISIK